MTDFLSTNPKIWEGSEGRLGNSRRITIPYFIEGVGDEYQARLNLLSVLPAAIDNVWVFDEAEIVNKLRAALFKFRVHYLTPEEQAIRGAKPGPQHELKKIGDWTFSFDTTGRVRQLKQSFGTQAYNATFGRDSGMDNYFQNAIDVQGHGVGAIVNGTPVPAPALRFNITGRFSSSFVTTSYAKLVSSLTGKRNDAAFPPSGMPFVSEQWPQGQVIFLGAVGDYSSSGSVDLQFVFEVDPGETVTLGSAQITRENHDFIWFRYEPAESVFGPASSKRTIPTADSAFVETTSEEDDLTQLFQTSPPPPNPPLLP